MASYQFINIHDWFPFTKPSFGTFQPLGALETTHDHTTLPSSLGLPGPTSPVSLPGHRFFSGCIGWTEAFSSSSHCDRKHQVSGASLSHLTSKPLGSTIGNDHSETRNLQFVVVYFHLLEIISAIVSTWLLGFQLHHLNLLWIHWMLNDHPPNFDPQNF